MTRVLKRWGAVAVVTIIMGVWLYQTLTPSVQVDFAVKTLALTFAAAGGITLFGEGTIEAARSFIDNARSESDRDEES